MRFVPTALLFAVLLSALPSTFFVAAFWEGIVSVDTTSYQKLWSLPGTVTIASDSLALLGGANTTEGAAIAKPTDVHIAWKDLVSKIVSTDRTVLLKVDRKNPYGFLMDEWRALATKVGQLGPHKCDIVLAEVNCHNEIWWNDASEFNMDVARRFNVTFPQDYRTFAPKIFLFKRRPVSAAAVLANAAAAGANAEVPTVVSMVPDKYDEDFINFKTLLDGLGTDDHVDPANHPQEKASHLPDGVFSFNSGVLQRFMMRHSDVDFGLPGVHPQLSWVATSVVEYSVNRTKVFDRYKSLKALVENRTKTLEGKKPGATGNSFLSKAKAKMAAPPVELTPEQREAMIAEKKSMLAEMDLIAEKLIAMQTHDAELLWKRAKAVPPLSGDNQAYEDAQYYYQVMESLLFGKERPPPPPPKPNRPPRLPDELTIQDIAGTSTDLVLKCIQRIEDHMLEARMCKASKDEKDEDKKKWLTEQKEEFRNQRAKKWYKRLPGSSKKHPEGVEWTEPDFTESLRLTKSSGQYPKDFPWNVHEPHMGVGHFIMMEGEQFNRYYELVERRLNILSSFRSSTRSIATSTGRIMEMVTSTLRARGQQPETPLYKPPKKKNKQEELQGRKGEDPVDPAIVALATGALEGFETRELAKYIIPSQATWKMDYGVAYKRIPAYPWGLTEFADDPDTIAKKNVEVKKTKIWAREPIRIPEGALDHPTAEVHQSLEKVNPFKNQPRRFDDDDDDDDDDVPATKKQQQQEKATSSPAATSHDDEDDGQEIPSIPSYAQVEPERVEDEDAPVVPFPPARDEL